MSFRVGRAAHIWPSSRIREGVLQKGCLLYRAELVSIPKRWAVCCPGKSWLHQQLQHFLISSRHKLVQKQGYKTLRFRTSAHARSASKIRKAHDKHKNFQSGDNQHLIWWEKKMEQLKKPVAKELTKRLMYSNLLGLDENLKNGSCKEGSLNYELLEVKRRFPREVLLCRVGEFYEAFGFDACVLVEYAGLNPMSGVRNGTVPRAGCPVMNLRQTLDDVTLSGFSVCVYEEVKAPSQARQRKDRFISGHAHPGSPYVYGLAGADIDLDFPEPVPVVGISRSARGYCLVSVLEMMRTFSVEDGLTEEAVIAKLRARTLHRLFLHRSLRSDLSGMVRWSEYGEGGLLWAECKGKSWEWFDQDPVLELLSKVRELYDLDPQEEFRKVVFPSKGRPRPLYVGTAAQIGILPTMGVPSLLKVLVPADCTGLCLPYLRDLLLNPPPHDIAKCIQAACKLMANVTCAIPDFTCVSAGKLVKLIGANEANYIEFTRIRNLAEDVLWMHNDHQLSPILNCLLEPTWLATGLQNDRQHLVDECSELVAALVNVLAPNGDPQQAVSNFPHIPDDFFQYMEDSWRGRVKRELAENFYEEVDKAAESLNAAVEDDFVPIVLHVRAMDAPISGGTKGDISFAREHQAVWFKGRQFSSVVACGNPVEEKIKALLPAVDGKGKRVREDWYTTPKVEEALDRYRDAVEKASWKVIEVLRSLAEDLKLKLNTIVFISVLTVIAKALFAHVSEGRRRKWVFPKLTMTTHEVPAAFNLNIDNGHVGDNLSLSGNSKEIFELALVDLVPYWLDKSQNLAVPNTVLMNSLHLLTGPNGGGKSSMLRSIGAAALLGICGLMVPAGSAVIPNFDAVMLRMMSQDSPADGKSSFQMEMSELRTILLEVTSKSLVLVDELCRGTEVMKGTAIAASVIESLDLIGCTGILSTHLHGLLDMKLNVKGLVYKAMGTAKVNGVLIPTWKLVDGSCTESLAFETARGEGVSERVIQRAEQLYVALQKSLHSDQQEEQYRQHISNSSSGVMRINDIGTNRNGSYLVDPDVHLLSVGEFSQKSTEQATSSDTDLQSEQGSNQMSYRRPENGLSENEGYQDSSWEGCGRERKCDTTNGTLTSQNPNGSKTENAMPLEDVEQIFSSICKGKLMEMQGTVPSISENDLTCVWVSARERPPPATTNRSCVYIMQRPDGKFYVGQTDNLAGRIMAHRSKGGLKNAPFIYVEVANKSVASELETVLINQLPRSGLDLVNKADRHHRHFGTDCSAQVDLPF